MNFVHNSDDIIYKSGPKTELEIIHVEDPMPNSLLPVANDIQTEPHVHTCCIIQTPKPS